MAWQVHLPLATRAMHQLKFLTQHNLAPNNLPTTAIRVSCTITPTHITISNEHGHLDPMEPLQHMWKEHLKNLAKDKCWALAHLELTADRLPLATAIQLGKA